MQIQIVGSSVGEGTKHQFLNSFLVNETLAIDAGSIGLLASLERQAKIQHVFLSHSHIDHVASLPIFLDNAYSAGGPCPVIYGSASTLDSLRRDVLNGRVWPDLVQLSGGERSFLELRTIEARRPVEIANLQVTPVDLDHVVPTCGFLVDDGRSAVAFVSDTAPTGEIWEVLNFTTHLKAVFLEVSFPNSLEWLAERSMHLTPRLFREELRKLRVPVPVVAIHLKPSSREQIVGEIASLGLSNVSIGESGADYEF